MPFDAAVRTAKLPNGLTYFIRQNTRPAQRVSLRLAVKAGSLFEADDQLGLAHLIEHMAFNGSAHFKPGELVCYFESVGARLGPHVNAYTSFDETVYMLDLPSDKPEVVEKGLTALADFAGGLTLRRKKSTRSAASSSRSGAAASAPDRAFATSSSRCSSTIRAMPSGCRSASPRSSATRRSQRLRAFYDTWYRPERQAIIVVGDIDQAKIEQSIKTLFSPLNDRAAGRAGTGSQGAAASAAVGQRRRRSRSDAVERADRPQARRAKGEQKIADYRRDLVARTIDHMMDERFSELERKPDAKFLGAGVGNGGSEQGRVHFHDGGRGAGRQTRRRSGRARGRGDAGEGIRLQQQRARSRQAVDGGVLPAGLHRARQDRERLVRAGIRQLLPQRRTEPGDRLRVSAGQATAAGDHRSGRLDDGPFAAQRRQPRDFGDHAAESRHQGPDRGRAPGGNRDGDEARGSRHGPTPAQPVRSWSMHRRQRRSRRAARWTMSASPSSASPTGSRRG